MSGKAKKNKIDTLGIIVNAGKPAKVKAPKVKKVYACDGVTFDSEEELVFYHWCLEAVSAGYIHKWEYHPESITLTERAFVYKEITRELKRSTKVEVVEHFLMHPHRYQADFIIWPTDLMCRFIHGMFSVVPEYYIDCKGSSHMAGRNANTGREFSINQKLVWQKSQGTIYVNKIVPEEFFQLTWVPEAARYTPVKRDVQKVYLKTRRIKDCAKLPIVLAPIKLVAREKAEIKLKEELIPFVNFVESEFAKTTGSNVVVKDRKHTSVSKVDGELF